MPDITMSCLCNTNTHTLSVPSSALPLPTYLCNCNISRRISGSLLTSYINIPGLKPDTSKCTAYHSSDMLKRWFCSTCGTHLYLEYHADGHFEASTGTVGWTEGEEDGGNIGDGMRDGKIGRDRGTDGLIDFKGLMWMDDTRDGGASIWLDEIGGKVLERWSGEAGESEFLPRLSRTLHSPAEKKEKEMGNETKAKPFTSPIHAHCHCNGIQFWIAPPTHPTQLTHSSTTTTKSPFPDLQIPHYLDKSANPDNVPWWIVDNATKYLAGTCTCTTCRLASGFDITFWAFIPTSHIYLDASLSQPFTTPNTPWPPESYFGSMKTYNSSSGVVRTFCAICGANCFFVGDEERLGRRGLVDVAVGLLDGGGGARCEEGLGWWTERVSFVEDVGHRGLGVDLERGLKGWGEERSVEGEARGEEAREDKYRKRSVNREA